MLDFAQFMPPTMITRSLGELQATSTPSMAKSSSSRSTAMPAKRVFRIGRDGANLAALAELFGAIWREPYIAQAFLPAVAEGDKRIVLVDGEVAGRDQPQARRRRDSAPTSPPAAPPNATELTDREREICAALGPELKRARAAVRRDRRDRRAC